MITKKLKDTVNIRVYRKTWKRAKISATKQDINLMDYCDSKL